MLLLSVVSCFSFPEAKRKPLPNTLGYK